MMLRREALQHLVHQWYMRHAGAPFSMSAMIIDSLSGADRMKPKAGWVSFGGGALKIGDRLGLRGISLAQAVVCNL